MPEDEATTRVLLLNAGEEVDEYALPDHDYYEVRSPGGALLCELYTD